MKKQKEPDCFQCKHQIGLSAMPPYCRAFPNGIPREIFYEGKPHDRPTKRQKNYFVFEKK